MEIQSHSQSYYQRNREMILQKSRELRKNTEHRKKLLEYQQNYFAKNMEAIKASKKKWREEHRDEIAEKKRETYREQVLEEVGRIVVPTAKKIDASGIERRTQKRLITLGDTMHKRHIIERRLEVNRLKAEAYKNLLCNEKVYNAEAVDTK